MDPLTAAMIAGTAIKGITGAAQYFKGRKLAKSNQRPTYNIPAEISKKLSAAEMDALNGLPEQQKQEFLQNMERTSNFALKNMSTRNAGLTGISSLVQNQNDANLNLLGMDAQARMNNKRYLGQVQSEMAGYKDQQFQLNQLDPYQDKAAAAQGLKGAGLQNVMNSIDSGLGLAMDKSYADQIFQDTPTTKRTGLGQGAGDYIDPNPDLLNPNDYTPPDEYLKPPVRYRGLKSLRY